MATKKNVKNDRAAAAAALIQQQRSAERRRLLLIVLVVAVVAGGILTAALVPYLKDRQETAKIAGTPLSEIGVAPDAAQCSPEETKPASGGGKHLPTSTALDYDQQVPAFGPHYDEWAPFDKKFYSAADRPALGHLVHNLEHGYSIVWYADDLAKAEVTILEQLATKFSGSDNENMVIVAPWTKDDGAMPEGKSIAMSHWSASPDNPTDESAQKGVWQYCGKVSGEAVDTFLKANPWKEAPEPGVQ